MYNTSNEYKNKLKSNEQQYTGYIQLEDGTKIEANGDLASISFSDSLGDKVIGNFVKRQVSLKILNSELDLTEKEFKVFLGLFLDKTNIEYKPFGTFKVVKIPDNDKGNEEITLSAEDYTYKFNKEVNIELLKNAQNINELLTIICNDVGVEFDTTEFTNINYVLNDVYYDEDSTYRDVVKQIVEMAGCNAKIGRDDKLHILALNMNVVKSIELNEQFEHKKSDVKYGPVNAIVASRIVADDSSTTEDVYARDEQSIAENGITEIKLLQNDLIDNDRQSAVNELLLSLNRFQYIPGNFEIIGDLAIDVGDYIEIKDVKNGTKFNTIIQDHNLNIDTGLSTISSSMKTKTETDYKSATEKEKRRKTEIKVNKLEGKITSVVKEQTEQSEKLTQIVQDNESITNTISNVTTTVIPGLNDNIDVISKELNETKTTIEGITNTLEKSGGNNLLLNSSGLFENEHWEGTVKATSNSDIQKAFAAKAAFLMQNGSQKQSITVVNGNYYIGFKYKKIIELAECTLKVNATIVDLTSLMLIQEGLFINVSDNNIMIELISNTNDACILGDIIIAINKQEWSANNNEIFTSTVKIGEGLEIIANTKKTKFLANADGIRIANTITNTVTNEFTDEGLKTNSLEASKAQIAGLLIQQVNGQTWISSLL